jgi:hypothetical protein
MKIANTAYHALIALVLSLPLIGCHDDNTEKWIPSQTSSLSVSSNSFAFAAIGDTQTFSVESHGNSWQLIDVPDWLTVTPTNGKSDAQLTLTAKENESACDREATFYLTFSNADWEGKKAITVSQEGATPYLDVDDSMILVSCSSQNISIPISTNIPDISFKTFYADTDWFSATYDSETKTISVAFQQNDGVNRDEWLYIYGMGKRWASIMVWQNKLLFTIDDGNNYGLVSFHADGGTRTAKIYSDLPWTATVDYNTTWVEVSPLSGNAGETVVTIQTLQFNESTTRDAHIVFSVETRFIGPSICGRLTIEQIGQ